MVVILRSIGTEFYPDDAHRFDGRRVAFFSLAFSGRPRIALAGADLGGGNVQWSYSTQIWYLVFVSFYLPVLSLSFPYPLLLEP